MRWGTHRRWVVRRLVCQATAAAKAARLAASERDVGSLQAQLVQLQKAMATSAASQTLAREAPSAADDVPTSSVDAAAPDVTPSPSAAVGAAPHVHAPPPSNGPESAAGTVAPMAGAASAAPPAAGAPAATSAFDDEATRLTREIEAQLRSTGMLDEMRGAAEPDGAGGSSGGRGSMSGARLTALSRMRKADLVAECEERGLAAVGTVAELRAQLRVERKRDGLVAQLVERGWSERQSRAALAKSKWDVDAAIASLTGK